MSPLTELEAQLDPRAAPAGGGLKVQRALAAAGHLHVVAEHQRRLDAVLELRMLACDNSPNSPNCVHSMTPNVRINGRRQTSR